MKIIYIIIILSLITVTAYASDVKVAHAIFMSEGGLNAQYLYGIRSVKYDTPQEARKICLNTIRNQRKRHISHICNLSYLQCLAKRYCPIGASNDPQGVNQYWLKNVKYFLNKGDK